MLSADAIPTGSSQNQTGSFENQTTASSLEKPPRIRKRCRGVNQVLSEITNQARGKRACQECTVAKILQHNFVSPRGDSVAGAKARWEGQQEEESCKSLQTLMKRKKSVINVGKQKLDNYVERNVTTDMNKAFSLQVFTAGITLWGLGIIEAASRASDVTGVSAYSIRKWASHYYMSVDVAPESIDHDMMVDLLSSERGRGSKLAGSLLTDEDFRLAAREYVRQNSCVRGEPNMTSEAFCDWISSTYGVTICRETARIWLHNLGFSQKNHHKGVYFDGHERSDVVEFRNDFVSKIKELEPLCKRPGYTPVVSEGQRPIIVVHHDESTFYSNADQSNFWSDGEMTVLKQKSLGQAIMVSDFIEEASGDYLRHDDEHARLLLETQTDGYFDSEKFLVQVDKAIDIFEAKYPLHQGLFLFDNAPSHKKCPDDALKVENMNVRPGGKQPVMRNTVFNGVEQQMVLPDGRPKGLKIVLQERGIDVSGMNGQKMREELSKFDDFKNPKTLVEEKVENRGHLSKFFPKFHCELNAIERCWCHAKKHSRAHANGTITRLRTIVPQALDTCKPDLISKFFVTCRDYVQAYAEGHTCKNVDEAVKTYKSHRRVFSVNS